ncbi:MAG TPA: hypothetical protein VNZ48_00225 [Xanthobacteraceae bacterium]|jgi:hypothetical protein|nr:hypothetical protein [Xanthobacteraceae bacterium]
MTVICHAEICEIPTIIGDLLITAPDAPTREVAIPIARDINRFVTPTDRAVVGLRQKVNIISDCLAVAWSGSLAQAEDVIPSLQPLAALEELNADLVKKVLESVESARKNALSLIVLVAHPRGDTYLLLHNVAPPQNFGKISKVAIAGSGRRTMLEVLQHLGRDQNLKEPVDVEMTSKGAALTIVGLMGGEELRSANPIREGWGGSFEIARFADGRFSKIGKQLFLYFRVKRADTGFDLWWLPFFRTVNYWNDVACVRAIQHTITKKNLLDRGREDIFLVTPLGFDNPDFTRFTAPAIMDHSWVVTYVFGAPSDDDVMSHVAHWGGPLFSYDFVNTHAKIAWRSDFLPDLCLRLSERLGAIPKFRGIGY